MGKDSGSQWASSGGDWICCIWPGGENDGSCAMIELDGCVDIGMGGCGLGDAVLLCCGVGGRPGADVYVGF